MNRYGWGGVEQASYTPVEGKIESPTYLPDEALQAANRYTLELLERVKNHQGRFHFGNFFIPDGRPLDNDSAEIELMPITISAQDLDEISKQLNAPTRPPATSLPVELTSYQMSGALEGFEPESMADISKGFKAKRVKARRYRCEFARPENEHGPVVLDIFDIDTGVYSKPQHLIQMHDSSTDVKVYWPGANSVTSQGRKSYNLLMMNRNTATIGIR